MRKFLLVALTLFLLAVGGFISYFQFGIYIDIHPNAPVTTFMTTDQDTIYMNTGNGPEAFTIKGVNLGAGIPGHWATEYTIDKETYLRWFAQIQEMGANTIRVYTILSDDFYNAFYEYNCNRDEPLYLLHGVWMDDYVLNSRTDGFDDAFRKAFLKDSRLLVDMLHGKRIIPISDRALGSGTYLHDISPWVIGYILGVEWEDRTVVYTNQCNEGLTPYQGQYISAAEKATPFESLLAEFADNIVSYESKRYKQQRLVALTNWATTDPFLYTDHVSALFMKCAQVDMEHLIANDGFQSGLFASYHIYPYYPDYLNEILNPSFDTNEEMTNWVDRYLSDGVYYQDVMTGDYKTDYLDRHGRLNTYYAYLQMFTHHHTMPVVISEFGVSTGRGMAHIDKNTDRNQGFTSEQEQGQALVACWEDIMDTGCAGGCVFTWQDEWFKRTWNTMHAIDLEQTAYWSDYQTNEQYFGLLAFDPGTEESICYVDGDLSEWTESDVVIADENSSVSMKYDEKFLYFLVQQDGFSQNKTLYIPIDTTPKSGSTTCDGIDLTFGRAADFLLVIDGEKNSHLLVQERYDVLRAIMSYETTGTNAYINPPASDSSFFKHIHLVLSYSAFDKNIIATEAETYETGHLTYGNANPDSPDFNSLADFIFSGDYVEIRLPWQLLNFSTPSKMTIHDDYYEHYGVEYLTIDELWVGVGKDSETISMGALPLKAWGNKVTYHERLKQSYYLLQEVWTADIPQEAPASTWEDQADGSWTLDSITWQDPNNAVLIWPYTEGFTYQIYRSDAENGTYTLLGTSAVGSYRDAFAQYPNTYFYQVRPVSLEGLPGPLSQPMKTGTHTQPVRNVPVIMYHNFITEQDIQNGVVFEEYSLSPEDFEADLQYLRDNGYTTITSEELLQYLRGETALPGKPIILSIDDGTKGVFDNAWPLLQQYGMKADLNVIGELIDTATQTVLSGGTRDGETAPYCTWDELARMEESGTINICSHSYGMHRYDNDGRTGLGKKANETAEEYSRTVLSDYMLMNNRLKDYPGITLKTLAYPYSVRDQESDRLLLKKTGYEILMAGQGARGTESNYFVEGANLESSLTLMSRPCRMDGSPIETYLTAIYETDFSNGVNGPDGITLSQNN